MIASQLPGGHRRHIQARPGACKAAAREQAHHGIESQCSGDGGFGERRHWHAQCNWQRLQIGLRPHTCTTPGYHCRAATTGGGATAQRRKLAASSWRKSAAKRGDKLAKVKSAARASRGDGLSQRRASSKS